MLMYLIAINIICTSIYFEVCSVTILIIMIQSAFFSTRCIDYKAVVLLSFVFCFTYKRAKRRNCFGLLFDTEFLQIIYICWILFSKVETVPSMVVLNCGPS